ncbi:sugar ABC transporter permease [Brachybacterium rhamnosum]|uniref:Carbohydrate ABC transporter permease n=1 Tax=Brachybacterium rhamnosum TaxID=173361 RepID=A0ABW4PUX4_9MICO|nr:sugar ABC transporter permease [Brachybacterium sp. SGAir0954]QCR52319.1 ABC transporter permease [Brachybacterium sp. SGAir0954]
MSSTNASTLRRRTDRFGYVFVAPAAVCFLAFLAIPILYALYVSVRREQVVGLGLGEGGRHQEWAGLRNYAQVLADPEFLGSAGRVLLYGLVLVPVMLGLALLFALLLDSKRARLRRIARITIFLPYAVPAVISSLLWGFLYLPGTSPFHFVADALGGSLPDVLSPQLVLLAIANIGIWGGTGFNMVVLYTSLRSVPGELYEAATLDGCSELQIALRVKVPMILPSLIMTCVFSIIATLQVFAEPMLLRPLTSSISTTWSPLMLIYKDAFTENDIYSASAGSVLVALATFVISFGFLRLVRGQAFAQEER